MAYYLSLQQGHTARGLIWGLNDGLEFGAFAQLFEELVVAVKPDSGNGIHGSVQEEAFSRIYQEHRDHITKVVIDFERNAPDSGQWVRMMGPGNKTFVVTILFRTSSKMTDAVLAALAR